MFISRPTFRVLLQLGVVIFSYSEVRGHNDSDVAPTMRGKATHGVAETKLAKYSGNCACGYVKNCAAQSSSTGVIENDYPMIAALAIIRNNTSYWVCQGTIIGPKYIMSTHYCSAFMTEIWAVVGPYTCTPKGTGGSYEFPIIHEDVRNVQEGTLYKSVDYLTTHLEVTAVNQSNIPVIYVLEKPIMYSIDVHPACLPIHLETTCGSEVYMIGWEQRPKILSTLERAALRVLPDTECIKKNGYLPNLLCVLAIDNDFKTTADAVGIYHTGTDGRLYLVGLIDTGSPRNGSIISALGIFPLTDWIIKETWH